MKLTRRALLNPALTRGLLVAALLMTTLASHSAPISEQAAHAIGLDAYLYFYPLLTMDLTRKQSTNIEPGKDR